jgi:response regulator RpfG family c-di-GMP phosphodiesterase
VDDDLDRAILSTSLRLQGYRRVHEARNLAQALDHARVFPMDALVLGERVGPLAAPDFLARLRAQGVCREVPALLLAGPDAGHAEALARAAGITHVQPGAHDLTDAFASELERMLR